MDDTARAMADAYAVLHAANYDALHGLIARLDSVLERQPMQGRVVFYAGVMRLWRATGAPRQLGDMFTDVTQSIKLLERAYALRPEDPHVGAFLGIAQLALGNVASDDDRIAQGRKIIEDVIPLYPAYVNGVLAQALGMVPRDHPFFADAAAAVRASLAACGNSASALETLTFEYPEKHKLGSCKALYFDGAKDNDPLTWMQEPQLCVGCHADEL